jgi:hypothetical protein
MMIISSVTTMGRFAEPEELAAAVAFLASDDSSLIAASTFLADGVTLPLVIAIGAQLFCGMSSVTANSQMGYAFSRIVADA